MKYGILTAAVLGAALLASGANATSHQHDENTSQHIGKTTTPAQGAKASAPTKQDQHDENTSQHVGKTTTPAMGAKASQPTDRDEHDENKATHKTPEKK